MDDVGDIDLAAFNPGVLGGALGTLGETVYFDGDADYYSVGRVFTPTPTPTVFASQPVSVVSVFRVDPDCTGALCSPTLYRGISLQDGPSLRVVSGSQIRAGGTTELTGINLAANGFNLHDWFVATATYNGTLCRLRIAQKGVPAVEVNGNCGTTPFRNLRIGANHVGGAEWHGWMNGIVMVARTRGHADLECWENYFLDGIPEPTPTQTPTVTFTPTATSTPTPTSPPGLTCAAAPFGSAAHVALAGSSSLWTNAPNVLSSNNIYDVMDNSYLTSGQYTDLLVASDIDLSSVPSSAVIYGLKPAWEGYRVGEDQIREYVFQFVDDTGTLVGRNDALASQIGATDATRTHGAAWDLFGAEWCIDNDSDCPDSAHVNLADSDTGIALALQRVVGDGVAVSQGRVDYITLEVCYVDAGTPTPSPTITATAAVTATPNNTATPTQTPVPTATPSPTRTVVRDEMVMTHRLQQGLSQTGTIAAGQAQQVCVDWIRPGDEDALGWDASQYRVHCQIESSTDPNEPGLVVSRITSRSTTQACARVSNTDVSNSRSGELVCFGYRWGKSGLPTPTATPTPTPGP